MKYRIVQYVRKHPGLRRREIAHGLQVWQCDKEFLKAMSELVNYGVLIATTHKDFAQMEFYDTYTLR